MAAAAGCGVSTSTPLIIEHKRVVVSGKQFYRMGSDGSLRDPDGHTGSSLETTRKAHFSVICSIRNPRDGSSREETRELDVPIGSLSGVRVSLIDLNKEGTTAPAEGTYHKSSSGLFFQLEGSVIKIYIPKLNHGEVLTDSDVSYRLVEDHNKYDQDHPEVRNMYETFLSGPGTKEEFSAEDLELIRTRLMPNMLSARDHLIHVYRTQTSHEKEIKISGKEGENQTSTMSFISKDGSKKIHVSVKILPDGMISYHISSVCFAGGFKKATFKLVSEIDHPSAFKLLVKISPRIDTRNPVELAYLSKEWDLMSALRHPGIASPDAIYAYPSTAKAGETETAVVIDKAYMSRGKDLRKFLGTDLPDLLSKGTYAERVVVLQNIRQLMVEITEGLKYLHEKGFIHQDLKLENILVFTDIDKDGKVTFHAKITDFGFAKRFEDIKQEEDGQLGTVYKDTTGDVVGCCNFIRGAEVSREKDLYALGSLFRDVAHIINESVSSPLPGSLGSSFKNVQSKLIFHLSIISAELMGYTETGHVTKYTPAYGLASLSGKLKAIDLPTTPSIYDDW